MSKQYYTIRNNILNYMTNNLSKIEGSYNYDVATAVSKELETSYDDMSELEVELFPWTVTKEPYLSYHLMSYGLTRLGETKAVGEVTFYGDVATLIAEGTIVISTVGEQYKTTSNAVISASNEVTVDVEAVNGGVAGNCGIGDITTFQTILNGVNSVTNLAAITGGAAIETVASCIERMKEKASLPAHSGNKNQYKEWVNEVGGIGRVNVIGAGEEGVPAGSVDIYFSNYDGTIPNAQKIAEVQSYLSDEDKIPVNDNTTVKAFTALELNLSFDSVTVQNGSVTEEEFIAELESQVSLALTTDDFLYISGNTGIVPFSKISNLALEIDGVVLFDNLTINNQTANLQFAYNQTPVLGTVEVVSYVTV